MPQEATMDRDHLAQPFEDSRGHLRAVAYRMLGSLSEAEDAVQEAWLRLSRTDTSEVQNLRGWLTTVVARVCLDMLRARKSRREESLDAPGPEPVASRAGPADPEHEAAMADSVGVAVLVVLETLNPAERLAFVLHDMFGVPFEEIADIVGRSPAATRQLASRARRRVQGRSVDDVDVARQRPVVEAFLAALRAGDFDALIAVLDPDLVFRADRPGVPGAPTEVRGAANWARGAVAFSHLARVVQPALIDGAVGLIVAPRGRLVRALRFTITGDKIVEADLITDPERLRSLDVAVLDDLHTA
jgi:RNA polymerase sigma factor (sigma-70 family)